jgi:hypothetical protein
MARWAWCVVAMSSAACSSGEDTVVPLASDGAPLASDGAPISTTTPAAAECFSDAGNAPLCIMGTASTAAFSAPATLIAGLFTGVPLGPALPVATQVVASDGGAWAFDLTALDAGGLASLYYVDIVAEFGGDASISRTVGPLSPGAPIAVNVLPVLIDVFESRVAGGGPMQLRSAIAHIFDPASGREIVNGTAIVSIAVGATSVPMPWDDAGMRYIAEPSPAPDASASYVVTIAQSALGSTPTTWQLAAVEPGLDGAIESPSSLVPVPVGPLTVTWTPVSGVDYVQVEVFEIVDAGVGGSADQGSGSGPNGGVDATVSSIAPAPDAGAEAGGVAYELVYTSPNPDPPSITQETIPQGTLTQLGGYLINVVSSKANCPPALSGCVYAGTVAAGTIMLVASDGGIGDAGP